MKPAFSVLFFTVTSGIGYGLLTWMVILQLVTRQVVNLNFLLLTGFIGLALATLGLLSSTLHLANPKNAWRAFNRFRTSWLSREGVFALLYYPVICLYALILYLNDGQFTWATYVVGVLSVCLAFAVVFSTGMIYASLKPIRQWHHPLVTPIYLLFSLLSGILSLMLIEQFVGSSVAATLTAKVGTIAFLTLLFISLLCKCCYFFSIGKPEGLTIGDATGFSQAQVKLLDVGHTSDTFLTKEFVFKVEAQRLLRLRWLAIVLVFLIPAFCVYLKQASYLLAFAFLAMYAGLLLERWLFFAEARHVVRLYHGDQRS